MAHGTWHSMMYVDHLLTPGLMANVLVPAVPTAHTALAIAYDCSILPAAQIEMGSTNVRVGSTIFGARQYPAKV